MQKLFSKCLLVSVLMALIFAGCSTAPQVLPTSTLVALTNTPEPSVTPTLPPTKLPTATATRDTAAKDTATFLKETYPDYSILKPGEAFVKTWEVKNIGTTTWTTAYTLALDSTPQNESLGSPAEVGFPQDTPPGGTASLSVHLIALSKPGTYAVYWSLKNERKEAFGVDGDRLWLVILVCEPEQPCSPPVTGGGTSANGVSATLVSFGSGAQSASASFCMTLPNRNYGPGSAGSVALIVGQQTILALGGGTLDAGCFEFEFSVTAAQIEQAKNVAVSIEQVRILGGGTDPQGTCQSARLNLMAQYPGLDFQCDFGMGTYYTNLQLPAGMTAEQAQQIIFDAIEGAIYGPCVLSIKN